MVKILQPKRKKVKVTISYNKTVAKRFHKTEYYVATAADTKKLPLKDKEKRKFRTKKKCIVSDRISHFKNLDFTRLWKVTLGIFKQRQKMANGLIPHRKAGQLMSILADPAFLATCYKNIRRKRGAMTKAIRMPLKQLKQQVTRKKDQVVFLHDTAEAPNRISYALLKTTGQLLKQGRYPWGISRRIFIPKPGTKDQLRPITIPPFMDKVVQEGIRTILESIYEPYFEKMNRSFGFRPNKGTHDAIYGLSRLNNYGMRIAIEGDIKAAYDKVNRQKLIEILSKEIEDHNFLKLIRTRLKYTYFDTSKRKFIREKEGIPQGGIDSPYLWNIYMLEFDRWIKAYMKGLLSKKNNKMKVFRKKEVKRKQTTSQTSSHKNRTRYRILDKGYQKLKETRRGLINQIRTLNEGKPDEITDRIWKNMQKNAYEGESPTREKNRMNMTYVKFGLIKQAKILRRKRDKVQSLRAKRQVLRYYYTRYADDWIILGNFGKPLAEQVKTAIKEYLEKELHATLSVEKTLITAMKQEPAKFLGFQLYVRNTTKVRKVIRIGADGKTQVFYARANNARIIVEPDKQRMLNRAFMKNFCDRKGRPREIPWLSALETISIIDRYNACIRGLANFYAEWVSYPRTSLHRWLYILKFSCLKTLAKKYKTSIKGIFKRFGVKTETQDTITYKTTLVFPKKGEMTKTWRLITAKEAIDAALALSRYQAIGEIFELIETNKYLENYQYPSKPGKTPYPFGVRVMDQDFLEKINWVTRRAVASMGMPCTLCGEVENVEMHHIKHIRKTPYSKIKKPWQQLMSLRNRRQIPVCANCHRSIIHTGDYMGPRLNNIAPVAIDTDKGLKIRIFDGRIVNSENYVQLGQERHAKSLEEKGWFPSIDGRSLSEAQKNFERKLISLPDLSDESESEN